MEHAPAEGTAMTVLGPVNVAALGITMTHEHLFADARPFYQAPGDGRFTLDEIHDNVLLDDEQTAIAELQAFRDTGGGTIVDVTTRGIGRSPGALARVSRASGVKVVMATGYLVAASHPQDVSDRDESALAAEMIDELREGVRDDEGAARRAGIIKVGCSHPLDPAEIKVLHAAAHAQTATGAPITIHVSPHDESALGIVAVLERAGADLTRTILGHLDVSVFELETLDRVADTGCFLEFDLFGNERPDYPGAGIELPTDEHRLGLLRRMIDRGQLDRILVSHDISTKHRLKAHGGHGYGHIAQTVVPEMTARGFTEPELAAILVENPARALAVHG